MRTDVQVGGSPVLAVVLEDVAASLRYPLARVRTAIELWKVGQTRVTKDFLAHGESSIKARRDGNSRRRKCVAILLSRQEAQCCQQLKVGMFLRRHYIGSGGIAIEVTSQSRYVMLAAIGVKVTNYAHSCSILLY